MNKVIKFKVGELETTFENYEIGDVIKYLKYEAEEELKNTITISKESIPTFTVKTTLL